MKKYQEAAEYLIQAREMDADSPEIGMALLLALFEIGNYPDAKILCEEMLYKGDGDYFEIIDIYLVVLIQLREYNKVIETINVLIEEKEIPPGKLEHYEKLLHFSKKRSSHEEVDDFDNIYETKPILQSTDIEEQILDIASLMHVNIQPYIEDLGNFLRDQEKHPFVQTMILNILKEHGIERNFHIEKLNFKDSVIPIRLPSLFETPFYQSLLKFIQDDVGQKNPSLYEQIKTIMDKHFFLLYPFELEPHNHSLWAAAYYCLGLELYGDVVNMKKIGNNYEVEVSELEACLAFLRKLEEISLPII